MIQRCPATDYRQVAAPASMYEVPARCDRAVTVIVWPLRISIPAALLVGTEVAATKPPGSSGTRRPLGAACCQLPATFQLPVATCFGSSQTWLARA